MVAMQLPQCEWTAVKPGNRTPTIKMAIENAKCENYTLNGQFLYEDSFFLRLY